MNDDTNPQPTPPVDTAALEKLAQEKAQTIADARIEQMKLDLAASISGKSGYDAPKSWQELEQRQDNKIEERAAAIADEKVKAALAARDKADEDKQKQTVEQTKAQQTAEWAQMSKEWAEAVSDGVIPDISPEVKKKLMADPDYSKLTTEEQNDPGLKAYNDGRILHGQLKQQGKSTSFYRTLDKFYNKQPAGARAPVLGGSTPTPQPSAEFTYDQVVANRQKHLKF